MRLKQEGGDWNLPELTCLSLSLTLCNLRGIFNSSQLSARKEQPVESWTNCNVHQSAKKHQSQFGWDFNRTKGQQKRPRGHKYLLLQRKMPATTSFFTNGQEAPILVDDPILALGMTVNFPPWKPFFDFPFRSYSCFRKKIRLTRQKVFPPPTVGVPSASKSPSALSAQARPIFSPRHDG